MGFIITHVSRIINIMRLTKFAYLPLLVPLAYLKYLSNLKKIFQKKAKNEFYSVFTIKNIKDMTVNHNLDVTSKISNIMFFTS